MRPIVIVEKDLSPFLKRLQKGEIVKGRIVLVLSKQHYLLRILGHNLVMKSNITFKRSQEVLFKIQETEPKLKLHRIDSHRDLLESQPRSTVMNLLIE